MAQQGLPVDDGRQTSTDEGANGRLVGLGGLLDGVQLRWCEPDFQRLVLRQVAPHANRRALRRQAGRRQGETDPSCPPLASGPGARGGLTSSLYPQTAYPAIHTPKWECGF